MKVVKTDAVTFRARPEIKATLREAAPPASWLAVMVRVWCKPHERCP